MSKRDQSPIEFPGLDVGKAKRYSRVRLTFLLLGLAETAAQSLWFAFSGRSVALRQRTTHLVPNRRLAVPFYVAIVTLAGWVMHLPQSYLSGHVVERRFGLTKQRWTGWLTDELKGFGLGIFLQVPLITGAYAVIKRRPKDWWLVLSAATLPLSVVLGHLAPVLIMPLFNTYTPLGDRVLAERIKALAERSGVKIADVYVMDMSRQTEKANAFFAGLGNTKRIVLSDTLLNQFNYEEIEAVVAHELGHQVHGDIWRLVGFGTVVGGASAFAAQRLAEPLVNRTRQRTGIRGIEDIASTPLLGLVLAGIGLFIMPVQNAFTRAIERRTDKFGIQLTGDGPTYARTMTRLATQNLEDPDPPAALVFLLYSHPPAADRVRDALAS